VVVRAVAEDSPSPAPCPPEAGERPQSAAGDSRPDRLQRSIAGRPRRTGRGGQAAARWAEVGRFLISGGIAAAVNFASAWACRAAASELPFILETSVVLGFVLGTLVSFVLNRSFTFRAQWGDVRWQFVRFCLVGVFSAFAAAGVAHVVALLLRIGWPDMPEALLHNAAHAVTIVLMTAVNYVLIKYFAFARGTTG
jgi:putative flippase GtrA